MIATWRPAVAAASLACHARRMKSLRVPCEQLMRTPSTPARIIATRVAWSSVAGPRVATIFVRLSVLMGRGMLVPLGETRVAAAAGRP